jgi:hypothetical protein
MTDLVPRTNGSSGKLVQLNPEQFADRLAQFGDEMQARHWVGTLLKFNKGKYLAGKEDKVIAIGTRLVAALDTIEHGYEKWEDGHLIETRTGLLIEGYQWPARDTLGDMDRNLWSVNPDTGQRRDPWQKSVRFVLYGKRDDKSTLYTFITRSVGGMGAVGDLGKKAGEQMRAQPAGSYPVIELQADSYKHPTYKSIVDVPVFRIVGWETSPWQGAEIRREV